MRDIDYLKLLRHQFPTARKARAEIINLRAILALPKGNEYFFSDIHGEYESFRYLLRNASGVVRSKIDETFGNLLTEKEQLDLANLIYAPERILELIHRENTATPDWYSTTIHRLITLCREAGSKYTRSKVRKKLPPDFGYAMDELLHTDENDYDKKEYYREIIHSIIEVGAADHFIVALTDLIHDLLIDQLHIIGDIFDRGPRADLIMDELMRFRNVDIQWGNHDVSWMGAAAGNEACIATVLRIATGYNSFDVLEDGYGINLRPLSMFASQVYADDPCENFRPHLLDENKFDSVSPVLAAKMCKAITIIECKAEGQLILRHPEYGMNDRLLLSAVDPEKMEVTIDGKSYPLSDTNFPTVNWDHPFEMTAGERELMDTLRSSFMHSGRLAEHIRFIYTHGSMYRICNQNLLFHGCIPMEADGSFVTWHTSEGNYAGRDLFDYLNQKVVDAYFLNGQEKPEEKQDAVDLMWYLWAGTKSPLFGKDKMTTFEHAFISDPALSVENMTPYYTISREKEAAEKILKEFGIDPEKGHIINGHVPVRVKKGESPVKADGKLYVIDGGLSKAYHARTGIAGYTLIFNSHHLALAEHKPFRPGEENTPKITITEQMPRRLLVRDTDTGEMIRRQILDLEELVECYEVGLLREERPFIRQE